MTAMASAINGFWLAGMVSYAHTDVILTEVVCTDLSSSSGFQGVNTTPQTGTRGGVLLPGGTCVLINYHMTRRYRGGKPRNYLPYLDASDLNGAQVWNSTPLGLLLAAWVAFIGDVEGTTYSTATIGGQCNVSYYAGFTNVPYGSPTKYRRTPTVRVTPVVDAVVATSANPAPASQRRRNGTRS